MSGARLPDCLISQVVEQNDQSLIRVGLYPTGSQPFRDVKNPMSNADEEDSGIRVTLVECEQPTGRPKFKQTTMQFGSAAAASDARRTHLKVHIAINVKCVVFVHRHSSLHTHSYSVYVFV